MLWVISGARRDVGKTYLAERLLGLLPRAVRAKIGHARPRAGKCENYFTADDEFLTFLSGLTDCLHCVVETNRPAVRARGDVRIFLGAPDGASDVREDVEALSGEAEVAIVPEADPALWRRVVADKVSDPSVAAAVCQLYRRQHEYLFGRKDRAP